MSIQSCREVCFTLKHSQSINELSVLPPLSQILLTVTSGIFIIKVDHDIVIFIATWKVSAAFAQTRSSSCSLPVMISSLQCQ